MYYKVLKSSFDGICGGESRYETIRDVLKEISFHKGWETKTQLHSAIKRWAKQARPGSVFTTPASAIVALPPDRSCRDDDTCHHCDYTQGLVYGDLTGEEGNIVQDVSCPKCGKRWTDIFVFADQQDL